MKQPRNSTETDPLERLFAAARIVQAADEGFSQRVASRLEPLPPSKNIYRIPTLATAFVSVLLAIWTMVSDFDFSSWTRRWTALEQREETAIRWIQAPWHRPNE